MCPLYNKHQLTRISQILNPPYPTRPPLLPDYKHEPAEQSVTSNDTDEDPNPCPPETSLIPVLIQNPNSRNLALGRKLGLVHAVAARATGVRLMLKLIYHHTLEDPSLRSCQFVTYYQKN